LHGMQQPSTTPTKCGMNSATKNNGESVKITPGFAFYTVLKCLTIDVYFKMTFDGSNAFIWSVNLRNYIVNLFYRPQ